MAKYVSSIINDSLADLQNGGGSCHGGLCAQVFMPRQDEE
ncbi:unnamed protein product [marine sediment metagenome]|uniref:Uncharacterized protein n=1 Tax=marine sediment metagenome TaxID=412755 RepID=X0SNN5_9ZZZZ